MTLTGLPGCKCHRCSTQDLTCAQCTRRQISWMNVSSYFLSDDCSYWFRDLAHSNVSIYAAAGATLTNSVTLSLQGPATVSLPVQNASTLANGEAQGSYPHTLAQPAHWLRIVGRSPCLHASVLCTAPLWARALSDAAEALWLFLAVGFLQLTYQNSIGYCVQDQNAPAGGVPLPPAAAPVGSAGASAAGSHIKWWLALIIGLAGGGLLLGGLAALMIWYGLRWKRSQEAAAIQLASKTVRCLPRCCAGPACLGRGWVVILSGVVGQASVTLHSRVRQGDAGGEAPLPGLPLWLCRVLCERC